MQNKTAAEKHLDVQEKRFPMMVIQMTSAINKFQ
jgi:hypothetical protein